MAKFRSAFAEPAVLAVLPLVAVPVVGVLVAPVALLDPLGVVCCAVLLLVPVVGCAGRSAAVPSKRAPDRAA
ncbi:MAG TPA: hypothetical protein VFP36_10855 [Usitatibacter sp.]|nr:hypothetical protein [Usitatibacter sp.]